MGIAASAGVAYAVSEYLNLFFGIIYFLIAFEFFFPITMKWMDKAYSFIYKE